jgi:hypothetical protein
MLAVMLFIASGATLLLAHETRGNLETVSSRAV